MKIVSAVNTNLPMELSGRRRELAAGFLQSCFNLTGSDRLRTEQTARANNLNILRAVARKMSPLTAVLKDLEYEASLGLIAAQDELKRIGEKFDTARTGADTLLKPTA